MKDLLKLTAVLVTVFASTFLLIQWFGLIPEEGLASWLRELREIDPIVLAGAVILLLIFDLFVAVPTMLTIVIAGWLLGPIVGGTVSAAGLLIMGMTAYGMGRHFGRRILWHILKDPARLEGIERAFARQDVVVLMACQALPMLPEISAALAGVSRMPISRFLFGYSVGVVPFAFIVAAGGAASSEDDLRPAVLTAIGTSIALLGLWRFTTRRSARLDG